MKGWLDSGDYGAQLFKRVREQERISSATKKRLNRITGEVAFLEDFDANFASYVAEINQRDLRPIFSDFMRLASVHWDSDRRQAFFKKVVALRDDHKMQRVWAELAEEIGAFRSTMHDAWMALTPQQQLQIQNQLKEKRAKNNKSARFETEKPSLIRRVFAIIVGGVFWMIIFQALLNSMRHLTGKLDWAPLACAGMWLITSLYALVADYKVCSICGTKYHDDTYHKWSDGNPCRKCKAPLYK